VCGRVDGISDGLQNLAEALVLGHEELVDKFGIPLGFCRLLGRFSRFNFLVGRSRCGVGRWCGAGRSRSQRFVVEHDPAEELHKLCLSKTRISTNDGVDASFES
jgi:hypothetical protein